MSTNACIAVHCSGDIVRTVYVHSDGYPEHTGKILQKYYNTQKKVLELTALGDMSVLKENMDGPNGHSYSNPAPQQTIFYHRDRGEDLNITPVFINVCLDVEDIFKAIRKKYGGGIYFYYFDGERWHCRKGINLEYCEIPVDIEEIIG